MVDNGFLIAALKKDGFLRFLTKTFFIIKSIASNTVMLDDGSSANLEPEVSSGIFTILVYSTYQTAIKQYQYQYSYFRLETYVEKFIHIFNYILNFC